jgi:His-Xaa-Ser system protein HxsD
MTARKKIDKLKINALNDKLELSISTKIYPLSVIYQTCYLFLDDYYLYLDGEPSQQIQITFKAKSEGKDYTAKFKKVAGEFYNELLNQLLRARVSQSNAKIREYIVAQALYNALPQEVDELLKEVEEEDWQKDPLGIAKPWQPQEQAKDKKTAKKSK